VNALAASPTLTCTSWCLGTHSPDEPCFSGYDTTPLSLHPPVHVITREGVTEFADEVRVGVEQSPGQPARVGITFGEGSSYELTPLEALAHALQIAARAMAALRAEVAS